jgi:hypothetical protein
MEWTKERLDKLASSVEDLERVMRQGFQVLTELHGETERKIQGLVDSQKETDQKIQKMSNAISALADHSNDHEQRIGKLEGEK